MSSEPEALRLADKLDRDGYSCFTNDMRAAAAELRRLHAESEALRSTLAASCDEERQQLWEAISGGGCSRALEAERRLQIATAELEAYRAVMREALEVLQDGREALQEQAQEFHRSMRGYKPERHEHMDEAVRRADAAIERLKARLG